MLKISNNGIITLTRGDSFRVPLFINQGTRLCPSRLKLSENPGSEVYFVLLAPNQVFENPTIRKVYTSQDENLAGDIELGLDEEDTIYLKPGKYFYEIKLKRVTPSGQHLTDTVIPVTEFILLVPRTEISIQE